MPLAVAWTGSWNKLISKRISSGHGRPMDNFREETGGGGGKMRRSGKNSGHADSITQRFETNHKIHGGIHHGKKGRSKNEQRSAWRRHRRLNHLAPHWTLSSARTSSIPADCHRREKRFHLSLPGKVLVHSATAVASLKSLAGSSLEGWIPNEEQGASSKLDTMLDTIFEYDRVL